jgi:hypothetical protein
MVTPVASGGSRVKYRGQGTSEITERVNFGKWTIRNRFYTTWDINKWGMIYFGSKPNEIVIQTLKDFETRLPSVKNFIFQNKTKFCFAFLVITTLWYNNKI